MRKASRILTFEDVKKRLTPLLDDKSLKLILLFGSTARGLAHAQSDVDLAFLYDREADVIELTNRVSGLLGTDRVDVVDLRRATPLLKFAAVDTCKIIYESHPGIFNEVYSLAFRRYVDTKKLRDAQKNSVRIFLEERGGS